MEERKRLVTNGVSICFDNEEERKHMDKCDKHDFKDHTGTFVPKDEHLEPKQLDMDQIWKVIDKHLKYGEEFNIKDEDDPKNPLLQQAGGAHYKNFKIQPAVYNEVNELSWAEGNVVKYVSRHKLKGKEEDLYKAIHMLKLILKLQYDHLYREDYLKEQGDTKE
jgi:hypothetical protein